MITKAFAANVKFKVFKILNELRHIKKTVKNNCNSKSSQISPNLKKKEIVLL